MRKIISAFVFLFFMKCATAHNPQVSTVSIIQGQDKKWSVFITAPLYTCQLAVKANNPSLKIDSLDVYALQKLIIALIKENLIINDDKNIQLINEKIQVAHETTVYFDIADTIKISRIDFNAFGKLREHFSLLKIVPRKSEEITYVLNSENGYLYPAIKEKDSFIDISYILYIVAAATTLFLFYITIKKKNI